MKPRQPVRVRTALLLSVFPICVGCAPVAPPEAAACGRLAGFYLGIHAPVEVTGFETEVETGKVRIDYRTTDAMNVPVEGVALCRFRQDPDGGLEATDAFVDENQLLEQEIAAFNASESAS